MYGGLLTLIDTLKVKKIIISRQVEDSLNYQKFKEIVKKNNISSVIVKKGEKIKVDGELYFDVLWPNEQNIIKENPLNNNSIVCKLTYKKFSMLCTGDIEEIAERQILKEYENNSNILHTNILKVAHHGSKTSSTDNFLDMVRPDIALIGVGEGNKFGHPNQEIIARLKNIGTKIYRTDLMGEISILIDGNGKITKINTMIKT